MDKSIVRFAVAAAMVAAFTWALFELITPCQFGAVWAQEKKAEETKKEEKKQEETGLGFTCRSRKTEGQPGSPVETTEMIRASPQYGSRIDHYDQGKLTLSTYYNYVDGTMVYLLHTLKTYSRKTGTRKGPAPDGQAFLDPRPRIKKALAGAHKKLGRRTIDGVEAEGIEIPEISSTISRMGGGMSGGMGMGTGSVSSGHEVITSDVSAVSQLWSSVETGLPILVEESATIEKDGYRMKRITDQFRWNVRFDPNEFQARIPAGYQSVQEWQSRFGGSGRGAVMRSPAPPKSGRKARR